MLNKEYVSPQTAEITQIIGKEKTLLLSRNLGGFLMYFSTRENSESINCLKKIIGEESAKKLCWYFKGSWVYIPKNKNVFKKRTEKVLLKLLKDKKIPAETIRYLALQFSLNNKKLIFA